MVSGSIRGSKSHGCGTHDGRRLGPPTARPPLGRFEVSGLAIGAAAQYIQALPELPGGNVYEAIYDAPTFSTATLGTVGVESQARDSTDAFDIEWTGILTADITTSGANGLDVGLEAADTWYALHVIGGGDNPAASLLSLSPAAPTLPGTYSSFRRIGWVRNDAAMNLVPFVQYGKSETRFVTYSNAITLRHLLVDGAAGVPTALSLATLVPSTTTNAYIQVFQRGTADVLLFTTVAGAILGGLQGARASVVMSFITDGAQSIAYQNDGVGVARVNVFVIGFTDYI